MLRAHIPTEAAGRHAQRKKEIQSGTERERVGRGRGRKRVRDLRKRRENGEKKWIV